MRWRLAEIPSRWSDESPAGALRLVAALGKLLHEKIAVISLDLDDSVLGGAAAPAALLQLSGQLGNAAGVQGEAGNDHHRFSAAPLALSPDAHDAVSGRGGTLF